MRRRSYDLYLGSRKMDNETAPRFGEIGRRKPGLRGAEGDQQHLVHELARMLLTEPVGQCRVDRSHGTDSIVLAAGIPVLSRICLEVCPRLVKSPQ